MRVRPVCTHAIRELHRDLPISLALAEGFKHLVKSLDTPFRANEGAIFFQRRSGGQYHVGIAAGFSEEDVLHDEELETLKCSRDSIGIGIGAYHVLTREIDS